MGAGRFAPYKANRLKRRAPPPPTLSRGRVPEPLDTVNFRGGGVIYYYFVSGGYSLVGLPASYPFTRIYPINWKEVTSCTKEGIIDTDDKCSVCDTQRSDIILIDKIIVRRHILVTPSFWSCDVTASFSRKQRRVNREKQVDLQRGRGKI